jgi:DUF4097 and DUF4098 domain-containing protein YvlB
MIWRKGLKYALLTMAALLMSASAFESQAQGQERELRCREEWYNKRLVGQCEIKEQTLPATRGTINVDATRNGGISVKGWDRNEILLRARLQTAAETADAARSLLSQIRLDTGARIHAEGPERTENLHWDVTYEIFVPRQSDLSLQTYNGGIYIADVRGRIEFEGMNGGAHLKRLAGHVRGSTTNGGIRVELAGSNWDGEGMDVSTTNGGVRITMPENYSARLETRTVNGSLNVDFPITVQGRVGKELSLNLGQGGATVRAVTTNGGVSVGRKEAEQNENIRM